MTLTDGISDVRLRACDRADNCGLAATLGPLWIDTVAPGAPAGLTSTSHTAGVASNLVALAMAWTPAPDATSGLAGYAFTVDGSASASCSGVVNLDGSAVSAVTSLPAGNWYVHLCAVDAAGLWGAPVVAGPFVVDRTPPRLTAVSTVASTADGVLSSSATY